MSSIALTVTSGIVHLRRREGPVGRFKLGRPPKLIGGHVSRTKLDRSTAARDNARTTTGRGDRMAVNGNIRLGRIGGVEVRVNWSLLVIFALIVWSLADGVFPSQNPGLSDGLHLAMAIVAAVLFFASLLLHELGHSWVARREGLEIDGITLWLFGGVSEFKTR